MEANVYHSRSDEELIALIRDNDHLALQALFNRYYKPLCRFAGIYIRDFTAAEEMIADLFIKIWDNRHRAQITAVKSYLFMAARNLSLNHLQKRKPPIEFIGRIELHEHLRSEYQTPFELISNKELHQRILSLINLLPERQREVLLLSRMEDLDKNKVSLLLGITIRTVETTLYQAVKSLRNLLSSPGKKI